MAADADIYSLFMGGPAAGPQAQAMAEALRRRRETAGLQRNAGNAALITGDRVLSAFGNAQLQQAGQGLQDAGQGEGMLAQAGGQQAGRQLQEALAQRQQEFQAGEGRLNRGLQRELEGMRGARENERAKARDEADKAKSVQDITTGLRKEVTALPEVKAFKDVTVAFDKMQRVAQNPSPAGDMSLIFNFMKMQDPGSTVREGEYANAQNAASWSDTMRARYNKAKDGQLLTDSMRADFLQQGRAFYDAHAEQTLPVLNYYRGLATKAGGDAADVGLDFGLPQQPTAPNAAPGSMEVETPPVTQGAPLQSPSPAAIDWARKNLGKDPRAKQILDDAGVK